MMKKQHTICTLLGITQQEAAMLLGVHRSQWSMYESGKRDLPLSAKQLLSEILSHVQASEKAAKGLPQTSAHQKNQQRQHFERLLRENQYQQLLLGRKIAAAEKKQAAQMRLSQLVDFLSMREAKTNNLFHQSIATKAAQTLTTDHAAVLMEYELRQELLSLEKILLESKMRKIALSTEINSIN